MFHQNVRDLVDAPVLIGPPSTPALLYRPRGTWQAALLLLDCQPDGPRFDCLYLVPGNVLLGECIANDQLISVCFDIGDESISPHSECDHGEQDPQENRG